MSIDGSWMIFLKEPDFRNWLLSHADTLDLTLVDNSVPHTTFFGLVQVSLPMKGDIVNPGTLATFRRLEPWFIRKETNNLMYGGCPQRKNSKIDHYYFILSNEIKDMLNQTTMLWQFYYEESLFKGFEDPVFYRNGKMIGYVTSHHYEGVLCPDDSENTYKI